MIGSPGSVDAERIIDSLILVHGEGERDRITLGVHKLAQAWTDDDGSLEDAAAFCSAHYVSDPYERSRLISRLETAITTVHGHLGEARRDLRRWSDLRGDDMEGVDDLLAMFNPAPDLTDQWYRQKLAFLALLNLAPPPLQTLLDEGSGWSDEDWTAVRIGQVFGPRYPVNLSVEARKVYHEVGSWSDHFHVPVDRMVDANGKSWFEPGRKLIAHWLIRDRIKAAYGDSEGLPLQHALSHVMKRHIDGSIPSVVMSGGDYGSWDPATNQVDGVAPESLIGPVRYEQWLRHVGVSRKFDELTPDFPTAIARKFEQEREIPVDVAESLLCSVLASPVRADAYALVAKKLGRPLEAHDVYCQSLAPATSAEEMDRLVRDRFGTIDGLKRGLPDLLIQLGYSEVDASFLADNIRVEVCKGAGHACPPALPEYASWMRTSSLDDELGWDGFDTAMHELGHNLEQVISCHFVPRPMLRGVPNTACTEAFAFLYQSLAREVLGCAGSEDDGLDAVEALIDTCEIAGPSLVELRTWRWLYEHPEADAEALRDAVLRLADEVWTDYFAAYFGPNSSHLMGAYQHMVCHPLYLADYAIGHLMAHQIASHVKGKRLADETRRICSIGCYTPARWMELAVGGPLSADALLRDAAAYFES